MAFGPPVVRPVARSVRPGAVIGALLSAAVLLAGVLLLAHVALQTVTGQSLDDVALAQARTDRNSYVPTAVWHLAQLVPELVAIAAGVIALIWTVRTRRWIAALCALGMIIGANLTTQVLKHDVLTKADLGVHDVTANSFPSGHTTATATLLLAVLLVVPPHARARAGRWGAVLAALTGMVTVFNGWHRPTDAAAGLLVVGTWGVLAVLALRFADAARARSTGGAGQRAMQFYRTGRERLARYRQNLRQREERSNSAYLPPRDADTQQDRPNATRPYAAASPRNSASLDEPWQPGAQRAQYGNPGAAASYPQYGPGPNQANPYEPNAYGANYLARPFPVRPRVGTVITLLVLTAVLGTTAALWPTPTVAGTWAGRVTLVAGDLGIASAAFLSWCMVARWLRSRA